MQLLKTYVYIYIYLYTSILTINIETISREVVVRYRRRIFLFVVSPVCLLWNSQCLLPSQRLDGTLKGGFTFGC